MTTNFALSLSFEGISLLHRVPGGWNLVGEVALDTPNLQADLADLRAKGLHLEPKGMRTKLLIPDSQIKFLALDNARATEDEILEALKGTTPYALEDLVIDYDRTGGRTYIAAVARETLEEAESFAADHKFGPISFAAIPEPLTFRGEVFFGPTEAAEAEAPGAVIDRDDAAVTVIGQSDLSGMQGLASKPRPQRQSDAPPPAEEAPEPVFSSRHNAADAGLVLAVPTGMAEGPALAPLPDAPPPAPQPVSALAPSDFAAPPLTGQPNGVAGDITHFSTRRSPELAIPAPAPFQTAPDPDVDMAEAPDDAGRRSGKPKYLGLILTAILLVFLFLVALWANTLSDDGIAGWFRPDPAAQVPETAVAIAPPVETQALPLPAEVAPVAPVPTAPAPETASVATPLPTLRSPVGGVLSPAEADRIYAATGVYQRAARLPVQPREMTLDGFVAAKALPEAARPAPLALPERDPMMPDAPLPVQRNPPAADVVFPRDLRGFILATPEGTLTPDGVMVYAGGPRITPRARPGSEVIVETPQVAVAPQALDAEAGVLLVPGQPPAVPPLRPEDLASDVAEAQASDVTTEDLATEDGATEDGATPAAEATEGLAVTDGRPDITPPVRPDSLVDLALAPDATPEDAAPSTETDTAAAPPGGVALASLRPEASPEREQTAPAVQSDPALAGYRPAARPEGLVPQIAQEPPAETPETPETPDLTAVVAAIAQAAPPSPFQNVTPQAIAASPRPDPRPRNFAQVVSRAQAAAARQQPDVRAASTAVIERQPAVAASAQPATPSGPVPGSVAQAATFDNAIRLRDMNLIGVYGRPNARRALVRLGNGRYVKVEVGSALDGGQVTAIGDSALNFVKRGRTYALQLPQG